jgi:leader peptidase (prepilin peptidase)/N-methyltransferase
MIEKTTLAVLLGIMAYMDWKERTVRFCMPAILAVAGILFYFIFPGKSWQDILAGCAVGAAMLVVSWIGKGSVGAGDGLVLMATGIFLGFWGNFGLLFLASLCAGAAAVVLLLTKKKGRKDSMPFVPFLFLAYLLQLIC